MMRDVQQWMRDGEYRSDILFAFRIFFFCNESLDRVVSFHLAIDAFEEWIVIIYDY